MTRRRALLIAFLIGLPPWLIAVVPGVADPPAKATEFSGKIMPLADELDKLGVKLDQDVAPFALALVTDDGKLYPLVKDPGSRMFFKDKSLLKRPVRIDGRTLGETKLLQVLAVRTVVKGKLHEPFYWCDICKIKRFEPNACDCCGAPLEFREEPVAK